jgi:hypothetical protein
MTSYNKTLTKQLKAWNDLFSKLTDDRERCKTQRFFHEGLFDVYEQRDWIDEKRRQDGSCSVCDISQFERRKPCIDGEKYHKFVRTGIVEYEEELKMIWKARQQ